MDTLVWTIARGSSVALVGEDGSVEGDVDLVAELRARLREPVVVHRRGTVAAPEGEDPAPLELRPGDGRYVVARIRTLCAGDGGFEVVGCDWR